jgi:PhzF family phenazine biosynthesis protein
MALKIYQVDAFAEKLYGGNPAAVVPLQTWLQDEEMQNIAMENNLAETAFYVKEENKFSIRWFTPEVEVILCGHATLAAAHVIFSFEATNGNELVFNSRSGELRVRKNADLLTLDFPADDFEKIELFPQLMDAFNIKPLAAFKGRTDFMLVFKDASEIRMLNPDFAKVKVLNARGVICTSPGEETDFVSRFFAPQAGINEDPVTGSSHTTLAPYWSQVLGKTELSAEQLSKRGGKLECKVNNGRVEISGRCKLYMKGELEKN